MKDSLQHTIQAKIVTSAAKTKDAHGFVVKCLEDPGFFKQNQEPFAIGDLFFCTNKNLIDSDKFQTRHMHLTVDERISNNDVIIEFEPLQNEWLKPVRVDDVFSTMAPKSDKAERLRQSGTVRKVVATTDRYFNLPDIHAATKVEFVELNNLEADVTVRLTELFSVHIPRKILVMAGCAVINFNKIQKPTSKQDVLTVIINDHALKLKQEIGNALTLDESIRIIADAVEDALSTSK